MILSMYALVIAGLLAYHLGRRAGARTHGASGEQGPEYPAYNGPITFLVPAWNARSDLEPFMRAFHSLALPEARLILCVGGRDGGFAVAQRYASRHVIVMEQHENEGKQRALRKMLPLVEGEIIYLTDIDCRPTRAPVEALLRPILAGESDVATGSVRPQDTQADSTFVQTLWAIVRLTNRGAGPWTSGLHGANSAVRRSVVVDSGGLDRDAPSGTDYTLAKELLRAGHAIRHVPQSEMPTWFPPDLPTYVRKQARWLRNVALLGARYRVWDEVLSVGKTVALPFALLALFMVGMLWPPALGVPFLLVLHGSLNRLHYARVAGLESTFASALTTVIADLGAGLLAGTQIVRRKHAWS